MNCHIRLKPDYKAIFVDSNDISIQYVKIESFVRWTRGYNTHLVRSLGALLAWGKTVLLRKLLERGEEMINGAPENILWCHGMHQPLTMKWYKPSLISRL